MVGRKERDLVRERGFLGDFGAGVGLGLGAGLDLVEEAFVEEGFGGEGGLAGVVCWWAVEVGSGVGGIGAADFFAAGLRAGVDFVFLTVFVFSCTGGAGGGDGGIYSCTSGDCCLDEAAEDGSE